MGNGVEGERLTGEVETESAKCVDDRQHANNHHGDDLGGKYDLYTELWQACAGPLVYVPRLGDRVFYFPQGHLEQVRAYTNEDDDMEMPIYNLPPKILCKVVNVQLKAEAQTDEVFAQITLVPEAEQEMIQSEDSSSPTLPQRVRARCFSKPLTPSDTSTHGGLSVPMRHAKECLPPLDMSLQPPVQDLVAKDLHGTQWHFRHIYRGQPKRHLITSGWSTFVTSKKLVAGDACIFLRGENRELRVGIRRGSLQHNTSTAVISGHSMQHGILASAFHAVSTGAMFTVYYRPWTTPEFIISYDQYVKSVESDCLIGTRFQMQFEGEDCAERRFAGTVVDIEDLDRVRWPNSEWRCLRVHWDIVSETRPERISPWDIEPIEPANKDKSAQPREKKARTLDSSPGFSISGRNGLFQVTFEHNPQEVLQGQEKRVNGADKSSTFKPPPSANLVLPQIPDPGPAQLGLKNKLQFTMHDTLYWCHGGTLSFSDGTSENSGLLNCHRSTYGASGNIGVGNHSFVSNVNSSSSGSQDKRAPMHRSEFEDPVPQPNGNCKFRLFGISLVNNLAELPSPQAATSVELQSPCSVPPITSQSSSGTVHVPESSKSVGSVLPLKQCKNCYSVTSRSCTKVLKYGTALGRSVDLTCFDGYDELIGHLDQIFEFEGKLIDGSCGWHVTYVDDEGDTMLIGDYPWQEFQSMVQRMFICPKEHTS